MSLKDAGVELLGLLKKSHAVLARHIEVRDQTMNFLAVDDLGGPQAGASGPDFVSRFLEIGLKRRQNAGLVIGDQDVQFSPPAVLDSDAGSALERRALGQPRADFLRQPKRHMGEYLFGEIELRIRGVERRHLWGRVQDVVV